jgi:signal peptide peptidase-like protein 3
MSFALLFNVFLIISVSIGTIWVGSHIDIIEDEDDLTETGHPRAQQHSVTMLQALIFPFYASAALLVLYFYFSYIQYFLVAGVIFSSWYSLYVICTHIYKGLPSFGCVNELVFGIFIASVVTLEWIRSGNIFCHDILGCALAILFISVLRFPSLKIAALTLGLLLLYDAFWVFYSEYIFEKNVMVEVATQNASNPVQEVGKYLNVEVLKNISPTINLPMKLIFPNLLDGDERTLMLGLGDIAMPGALVAFAKRSDNSFSSSSGSEKKTDVESQSRSHAIAPSSDLFEYTLLGYIFGLFLAFLGNYVSSHPQPALIYIVPCTLFFLSIRAYQKGRMKEVWSGLYKSDDA